MLNNLLLVLKYINKTLEGRHMKKAFTLAETLITLGIIGIVAAITIPGLINTYRDKATVNQLKKTYSILSQAHKMAIAENGEADSWDIGDRGESGDSSLKLYQMYKPYLKISEDCGKSSGCFKNGYRAMYKGTVPWQPSSWSTYARTTLLDGTSLAFYSAGSGCKSVCGSVYVDINGRGSKNQAGIDYFKFLIYKDKIEPISPKQTYEKCAYKDTSNLNGVACTKWVLTKGNLDYLRRDVSTEMSKL